MNATEAIITAIARKWRKREREGRACMHAAATYPVGVPEGRVAQVEGAGGWVPVAAARGGVVRSKGQQSGGGCDLSGGAH